jgi:uncharacterized repeat protein (TIGR03803 family)
MASLAFAIAAMGVAPAPAQVTETLLHRFTPPPKGANPYSGLLRDSAGDLYGTTGTGGAENAGAVYKLDTKGHLTVLYSFTGGSDGSGPRSGVIRDSAGNLYGTTAAGGTANVGVVYELDTTGQLTVLHSFTGWSDGAYPEAGVIRDSAGNLYGTTSYGGTGFGHQGGGVVYKLDTTNEFTVLYSFVAGTGGEYPFAGVISDSAGNLYGTTYAGGAGSSGVVFKLDTSGNETVLYSFTGGADGANPYASVISDSAGNLYGTTFSGGTAGWGVVFKLDTSGNETVLHSFASGTDGANPTGVIRDSVGDIYGTTIYGGPSRAGVVYRVSKAGTETALYSFTGGTDGMGSYAGVVRDSAGNLYGTTAYGGAAGVGVAFKLDTSGVQTLLFSFPQSAGGFGPNSGVIRDSAGDLYGTTPLGGTVGAGAVYKLDPAGHETVLYSFTGGADGNNPNSGVVRDSAGNLYGTTFTGGTAGAGLVYKLDTAGNQTVLYTFTGGADGSNPYPRAVRDPAGNLYGTTWLGGTADAGVIYKVDTKGNETVLYNFTGSPGAARSYSPLFRDSAGNLYGTIYSGGSAGFGAVYKLDKKNNYTVLYNFTGGADGRYPYAGVTGDSAGNLYGTTEVGGAPYAGVIYKLDSSGNQTVLYSFTGGADGHYPNAGVVLDSAGNLYGTTYYGGTAGLGVVYELSTTNQLTVLYSFTGVPDGANPDAGVIRDSAGNLYGTTQYGGKGNVGVVFKLKGVAAAE